MIRPFFIANFNYPSPQFRAKVAAYITVRVQKISSFAMVENTFFAVIAVSIRFLFHQSRSKIKFELFGVKFL